MLVYINQTELTYFYYEKAKIVPMGKGECGKCNANGHMFYMNHLFLSLLLVSNLTVWFLVYGFCS
jgi:hypothetical protein